ncbi:MAG: 50S ribosomal protein L13 [Patescibacteria group bacterium]|jgi:large subunit ribosomal protein L13
MKEIERKTHQLDATGQPVGRLATRIAIILRGKNKATFTPNIDAGDFVEVANCSKLKLTGKKLEQKEYKWHTTHPGGLKIKKTSVVMKDNAGEVLRRAVWGMLPKNKLRDQMIKRLKTTN